MLSAMKTRIEETKVVVLGKVRTKVYQGYCTSPGTTRIRHSGKLGTTSIAALNTFKMVSLVRPRQITLVQGTVLFKYQGAATVTGTTSCSVPDTLVSLVRHPYLYPLL